MYQISILVLLLVQQAVSLPAPNEYSEVTNNNGVSGATDASTNVTFGGNNDPSIQNAVQNVIDPPNVIEKGTSGNLSPNQKDLSLASGIGAGGSQEVLTSTIVFTWTRPGPASPAVATNNAQAADNVPLAHAGGAPSGSVVDTPHQTSVPVIPAGDGLAQPTPVSNDADESSSTDIIPPTRGPRLPTFSEPPPRFSTMRIASLASQNALLQTAINGIQTILPVIDGLGLLGIESEGTYLNLPGLLDAIDIPCLFRCSTPPAHAASPQPGAIPQVQPPLPPAPAPPLAGVPAGADAAGGVLAGAGAAAGAAEAAAGGVAGAAQVGSGTAAGTAKAVGDVASGGIRGIGGAIVGGMGGIGGAIAGGAAASAIEAGGGVAANAVEAGSGAVAGGAEAGSGITSGATAEAQQIVPAQEINAQAPSAGGGPPNNPLSGAARGFREGLEHGIESALDQSGGSSQANVADPGSLSADPMPNAVVNGTENSNSNDMAIVPSNTLPLDPGQGGMGNGAGSNLAPAAGSMLPTSQGYSGQGEMQNGPSGTLQNDLEKGMTNNMGNANVQPAGNQAQYISPAPAQMGTFPNGAQGPMAQPVMNIPASSQLTNQAPNPMFAGSSNIAPLPISTMATLPSETPSITPEPTPESTPTPTPTPTTESTTEPPPPVTTTQFNGEVVSCASGKYPDDKHEATPECAGETKVISTVESIASAYAASVSAKASAAASKSAAEAADASWTSAAAKPSATCDILSDNGLNTVRFRIGGMNGWTDGQALENSLKKKCHKNGFFATFNIKDYLFYKHEKSEFQGRERDTQKLTFQMTWFKGGCVEEAVEDAGGPKHGKGDGELTCKHAKEDKLPPSTVQEAQEAGENIEDVYFVPKTD
ncbi:hypothetical protein BDV26DRAFT_290465 [Aspergillus bertholletiae]|uniref:Uncharacterized protein n=1 Tax=Aspergillus bertholletiae TaxID=1226010 RepID=A0A5N7BF15_9EURO|nr:hypothetical protein BDV26DRAFT_290465 [Aspergillus bertholletiae]